MSQECQICGKKSVMGNTVTHRGKAKYLGGVGKKTTGITKRKFKVNMQRVRAVIDGQVVRMNVSAKAIKSGAIVKPAKRNYKPEPEAVA